MPIIRIALSRSDLSLNTPAAISYRESKEQDMRAKAKELAAQKHKPKGTGSKGMFFAKDDKRIPGEGSTSIDQRELSQEEIDILRALQNENNLQMTDLYTNQPEYLQMKTSEKYDQEMIQAIHHVLIRAMSIGAITLKAPQTKGGSWQIMYRKGQEDRTKNVASTDSWSGRTLESVLIKALQEVADKLEFDAEETAPQFSSENRFVFGSLDEKQAVLHLIDKLEQYQATTSKSKDKKVTLGPKVEELKERLKSPQQEAKELVIAQAEEYPFILIERGENDSELYGYVVIGDNNQASLYYSDAPDYAYTITGVGVGKQGFYLTVSSLNEDNEKIHYNVHLAIPSDGVDAVMDLRFFSKLEQHVDPRSQPSAIGLGLSDYQDLNVPMVITLSLKNKHQGRGRFVNEEENGFVSLPKNRAPTFYYSNKMRDNTDGLEIVGVGSTSDGNYLKLKSIDRFGKEQIRTQYVQELDAKLTQAIEESIRNYRKVHLSRQEQEIMGSYEFSFSNLDIGYRDPKYAAYDSDDEESGYDEEGYDSDELDSNDEQKGVVNFHDDGTATYYSADKYGRNSDVFSVVSVHDSVGDIMSRTIGFDIVGRDGNSKRIRPMVDATGKCSEFLTRLKDHISKKQSLKRKH